MPNFVGFIYSIGFCNYAASSFHFSFPITGYCTSFSSTNCAMNCPISQYQITGTCLNCSSTCTTGCVYGSSCNVCNDSNCINCTSFSASSCVACSTSLTPYANCTSCATNCSTCSGINPNQCLTCYGTSNVLYKNICVQECPNGYNFNGTLCVMVTNSILSIKFNGQTAFSTVNGLNCGSSNTAYDLNDPLPSQQKGYYFRNNSYISGYAVFSPDVSVNIWVKTQFDGYILNKSSLFIINVANGFVNISLILDNYEIISQIIPEIVGS